MGIIFRQYIMVFATAMVPVAELRVAIPAGIAMGLNPWLVLLFSVAGNLLPVPFIILFIRQILSWMQGWGGIFRRAVEFVQRKADKASELFYRYELVGLFLLVAIPLPGTGAWTGALVAAMLRLRMKVAWPVISAGVLVAGLAVLGLSCGIHSVL